MAAQGYRILSKRSLDRLELTKILDNDNFFSLDKAKIDVSVDYYENTIDWCVWKSFIVWAIDC